MVLDRFKNKNIPLDVVKCYKMLSRLNTNMILIERSCIGQLDLEYIIENVKMTIHVETIKSILKKRIKELQILNN